MILLPTTLAPIYLQDGGVWGKGRGEGRERSDVEGEERRVREERREGREGGGAIAERRKGAIAKVHTRHIPATTSSRCGSQATQQSC